MNTNKSTLKVIGIIVLSILAYALVTSAFRNSTATGVDPNNNTARNAMIVGCTTESAKSLAGVWSEAQIKSYCECAIRKIEQKYPDILTNDSLANDKLKNGFSQEDIKLIADCITAT